MFRDRLSLMLLYTTAFSARPHWCLVSSYCRQNRPAVTTTTQVRCCPVTHLFLHCQTVVYPPPQPQQPQYAAPPSKRTRLRPIRPSSRLRTSPRPRSKVPTPPHRRHRRSTRSRSTSRRRDLYAWSTSNISGRSPRQHSSNRLQETDLYLLHCILGSLVGRPEQLEEPREIGPCSNALL
jgi:hypothetical protein